MARCLVKHRDSFAFALPYLTIVIRNDGEVMNINRISSYMRHLGSVLSRVLLGCDAV
jgi:hypothetical protein